VQEAPQGTAGDHAEHVHDEDERVTGSVTLMVRKVTVTDVGFWSLKTSTAAVPSTISAM
jgi:hypothetical protein